LAHEGGHHLDRVGLPLKMVLKVHDPAEMELFERVVRPAVDEGVVDFLGELPPAERDPLYAGARATLMLGSWPEPFGLVAIESLASGTPVIARRAGALPEIVEHGADGYLVEDLSEAELAVPLVSALHRADIRQRALQRFSAARMADDYERIYRRSAAGLGGVERPRACDGLIRPPPSQHARPDLRPTRRPDHRVPGASRRANGSGLASASSSSGSVC